MTFYFTGQQGALRTYFQEAIGSLAAFSFVRDWYSIAIEDAAATGLRGIGKHLYALAETRTEALETILAVAFTPLEILATEALHFAFHLTSVSHFFYSDGAVGKGIGKYQIVPPPITR